MKGMFDQFVEEVDDVAAWRSSLAEESPVDPRNENSTKVLLRLHEYILKSDDAAIPQLKAQLENLPESATEEWVEQLATMLGYFGFSESMNLEKDHLDRDCHNLLGEIISLLTRLSSNANV